jgi:hypothetical protein
MNASSRPTAVAATLGASIPPHRRSPQRITITVSYSIHEALLQRSDNEGRSLSNLAAFLLERSIA